MNYGGERIGVCRLLGGLLHDTFGEFHHLAIGEATQHGFEFTQAVVRPRSPTRRTQLARAFARFVRMRADLAFKCRKINVPSPGAPAVSCRRHIHVHPPPCRKVPSGRSSMACTNEKRRHPAQ